MVQFLNEHFTCDSKRKKRREKKMTNSPWIQINRFWCPLFVYFLSVLKSREKKTKKRTTRRGSRRCKNHLNSQWKYPNDSNNRILCVSPFASFFICLLGPRSSHAPPAIQTLTAIASHKFIHLFLLRFFLRFPYIV